MARVGAIKFNQVMANSIEKVSTHGGEKMSNYVNAVGKAFVAPLVIIKNPFSKEPEKNRKWAGVKQVVEAGVTLGIQLLALGQLYKGIDKLAAKGKLHFNPVKIAKETGVFPKKFAEKIKQNKINKTEAIKNLQAECTDIFKDRLGTILAISLYVPTLAITNRIFPKIAERIVKNENK